MFIYKLDLLKITIWINILKWGGKIDWAFFFYFYCKFQTLETYNLP